jgi:hypothetical protein
MGCCLRGIRGKVLCPLREARLPEIARAIAGSERVRQEHPPTIPRQAARRSGDQRTRVIHFIADGRQKQHSAAHAARD